VPNAKHRFAPLYTCEIGKTLEHLGVDISHWNEKNILDICCGNGFLSYHLLKINPHLQMTLLDINKTELDNAKLNISELSITHQPSTINHHTSPLILIPPDLKISLIS